MTAPTWFAVTINSEYGNGIQATANRKREIVAELAARHEDDAPTTTKSCGIYEYDTGYMTYFVGTRASLEAQGFGWAFDE